MKYKRFLGSSLAVEARFKMKIELAIENATSRKF